jgi:pullulanase
LLARAFWVNADLFLVPVDADAAVTLHASETAALGCTQLGGVVATGAGAASWALEAAEVPAQVFTESPWLARLKLAAFRLNVDVSTRRKLLKCQLVVEARQPATGAVVLATCVQHAGALDALCAYDGPLGVELLGGDAATLRLWAPTAQVWREHERWELVRDR